jgi:outer membrane protein assembly factor BamC
MMSMRSVAAVLAVAALCACSGFQGKKIDYRSAGKVKSLKVPEDLSAPPSSDRYKIPEAKSGSATFSEYREGHAEPTADTALLPKRGGLRIERAGSQRWLVAQAQPETLWPVIREFWQDTGFLIDKELPEAGIMETDWAENRAKIPEGIIRRTVGRLFENLYSYPERDKFRTRLERNEEAGVTEIYISHRGMYQVVVAENRAEKLRWQVRPVEPELEAEMLARLMQRLGADEKQVRASEPVSDQPRARIDNVGQVGERLWMSESFDRAWRRVGLALDRVGFTVEDRDRSQGVFYVRYVDLDAKEAEKSRGFWSKLFSGKKKNETVDNEQYRINVAEAEQGSAITVLDKQGSPAATPTAAKILALLQQELK